MKYENSKSVILTFLILVSIILTWNLWTYQPNFDMLESDNYVAEVKLREKQELQKIIKPDQVLFHSKGQHYGTTNSTELDKIMKEIREWPLEDVKNISDDVGDIKEVLHGSGSTEIIFPTDVPIQLYKSVLDFEEKKLPSFNFKRMVINVDTSTKQNGTVYFISADFEQVYQSQVRESLITGFNRNFFNNADQYQSYFTYEASDQRTIFLPDGAIEMMEYMYLPVVLNSEEFKEALFTDPRNVQKSSIGNIEEYLDASSKMTVNNDSNMLVYVNPTAESNHFESSYDLLMRSIDFVNQHGGWTDSYRYAAKNESDSTVSFRLYSIEGYPVFNEQGMSEIHEVWGQDEITRYVRPNIALELPLEMKKVALPSGRGALEFLKSRKNFKPELLEQVTLGYRMTRATAENNLILLEPAWFYRYNKTWGQITKEDLGGSLRGLE